jgi:hypothetical protein
VLYKPCIIRILKQCAEHTERAYALKPDVWLVGRALVLDSTRVCFSLVVFLGFIRHRICNTLVPYWEDKKKPT